jgi:hypothetical protein
VITFSPLFPDVKLLQKAVKWSLQNRYHIPSLTLLAGSRGLDELTETGRAWQAAGLGTMIEMSAEGVRSVHFSLNDDAVLAVQRLNQQSFFGRLKAVNRSDWIAFGAFAVSVIALIKD